MELTTTNLNEPICRLQPSLSLFPSRNSYLRECGAPGNITDWVAQESLLCVLVEDQETLGNCGCPGYSTLVDCRGPGNFILGEFYISPGNAILDNCGTRKRHLRT